MQQAVVGAAEIGVEAQQMPPDSEGFEGRNLVGGGGRTKHDVAAG